MIKGKSPFPFETVALAVSFAPGLSALVAETKRIAGLHSSTAIFIHIGKKTSEKQRELSLLLSNNGFHDGNSRIYWEHPSAALREQGEIVQCVLRICKHEVVDLLIAGTSDRENFRLPVGRIASEIATKAKCSVLIVRDPAPQGYKRIVVNGVDHKKSDMTLLTALYFAEKQNAENIFVADDNTSEENSNDSRVVINSSTIEGRLQDTLNKTLIPIKYFSLQKEQYRDITEFAFKNKADLIVTNSSDHHLLIFDRISTSDGIDSMLKDLSSNLLIIHSRISE